MDNRESVSVCVFAVKAAYDEVNTLEVVCLGLSGEKLRKAAVKMLSTFTQQ